MCQYPSGIFWMTKIEKDYQCFKFVKYDIFFLISDFMIALLVLPQLQLFVILSVV